MSNEESMRWILELVQNWSIGYAVQYCDKGEHSLAEFHNLDLAHSAQ